MKIIAILFLMIFAYYIYKAYSESAKKIPRLSYLKFDAKLTDIDSIPDNFIVADIETTGFTPKTARIIEVSAIKIKKGEDQHLNLNALVDPGTPIPAEITELTGITDKMVKWEDKIEKVIIEFLDFFEDLPIVFYNANFDMRFLRAAAKKVGREINNEVIDALPIARKAFPELKNHKLSTVANHLNINSDGAHRASDDCGMTLMVLEHASHKLAGNEA